MSMEKNISKYNHGVSLLEMVVAIAVFAMMTLSATAIFQMVMDSQRNAVASQNTQESLRYMLEVMSKEIRSAERDGGVCVSVPDSQIYAVTTNTFGDVLNFKNYQGKCVSYYLNNNSLLVRRDSYLASTTPATIKVSNLRFIATEDVTSQARLTLKFDAEAIGRALSKQAVKIQTTISSRFYD